MRGFKRPLPLFHGLFEDEGAFGKVFRVVDSNALKMAFVDIEIVVPMRKDGRFRLPRDRLWI